MTITPITLMSLGPQPSLEGAVDAGNTSGPSFMRLIGSGLESVDQSLAVADQKTLALAAGEGVPLHDVMMAMEQAHLKLQFAVEVRNRVVDAYQNLTNMQI